MTLIASEATTTLNLAGHHATEHIAQALAIDNLLDETYIAYRDTENSPGLNTRLGLTMRLGAK